MTRNPFMPGALEETPARPSDSEINLSCEGQPYDLVLGTLFLFRHKVMIGSVDPLPMKGARVATLESRMSWVYEENLDKVREQLKELAQPLCAINHTIPLIDEGKIYPRRLYCCPEPLRPRWADKRSSTLR
ncbi:hypothetical protein BDR05DRAFT_280929 [Suillus weaverae]|nr:hypothetical protein BDR05DRAFT_280929 [Suillus weaverae]